MADINDEGRTTNIENLSDYWCGYCDGWNKAVEKIKNEMKTLGLR